VKIGKYRPQVVEPLCPRGYSHSVVDSHGVERQGIVVVGSHTDFLLKIPGRGQLVAKR
jgi:hypothetical protein